MSDSDASGSSRVEQLKKLLIEYGSKLLEPCDSTEELLRKLDKLERLLSLTFQDEKKLVEVALQPPKKALIANGLIRHAELDVKVSVASCISEIVRITAPDEPYEEDQMKEFFQLAISAFESLSSMSGRVYSKAVSILKNISYSESCVMMLDLGLYAIVHQMFHLFLDGIRTSHSHDILSSMENIMTVIIHNNVDYDEFLLALVKILLDRLKKEIQNVSPVAFQLAAKIFKNCSADLKTYLPEAVRCLGIPVDGYAEVVVSLFRDATQMENLDSIDTAGDVSYPGEAGLAMEAGLCNLTEGNETENLKNDENCCDESPNLCCQKHMEQEQKPDIPILEKRTRKRNCLMKGDEGYDPFWMLVDWKLFEDSHCKKPKRKKTHRSRSKISKDSKPAASKVRTAGRSFGEEVVGCKIKVWWPLDQMFYKGKITAFDHANKIHRVEYGDGDVEFLDLTTEHWQLLGNDNLSTHEQQEIVAAPSASTEMLNDHGRKSSHLTKRKKASMVRTHRSFGEEVVGCKIKVWWPLDQMFYEGKITTFDHENKIHRVEYDDGDVEFLDLTTERWQLLGSDNLSTHEIVAAPSASTKTLNDGGRKSSHLAKRKKASEVKTVSRSYGKEVIGQRIKVWWRSNKMFFEGKIMAFDHVDNLHQVDYDNGIIEFLDLTKERMQLLGDDELSTQEQQEIVAAPSASTET